ncbi:MAG: hypothetical protein KVP17_002647 [Porospora cf. gigantea B]|uniref:uncharacterized protein n=1 Tax=Porospora cf. gigantea B TaxID=2853592 RepID=UPI00357180EF|nr:MAG: hypothetical protein KVP17_002647 [Porospora cf. gigantea B]
MRYLQLLSSLLIAVSVAQQVNAPSPETPLVPTVNAVLPGRATEWKTAEATAVTTLPTTASARVPTQLPGLPAKSSQVLTDDDFEHLTQAATGSTTGPWFVMFYAPWCGHCRMMSAEWEKLASMAEEFSVARVDATANIDLARRFEIRGFPTVLFFNKGKLYKYSGRRTAEAMMSFATNGYMSVEGVLVPRPKTFMDKALTMVSGSLQDVSRMVKEGRAGTPLTTIAAVAGLLAGVSCSACIACRCCRRKKIEKKD